MCAHVVVACGLTRNHNGVAADALHHADIIMDVETIVALETDVAVIHDEIASGVCNMESVHRGGDTVFIFGSRAQADGNVGEKHVIGAVARHKPGAVGRVNVDILIGDVF